MGENIHLKDVWQVIKRRLWIVVLIPLLAMATSAALSYSLVPPIYEAKTQLLVNQPSEKKTGVTFDHVQTNVKLVSSYHTLLQSPRILNTVIGELKLERTAADLQKQLSVTSEHESQVIDITVKDGDEKTAEAIANTIAEVFSKEVVKIMKLDNVDVLTEASVSKSSKFAFHVAIAFVVGLIAAIGFVFFQQYWHRTITSEQDVERVLQVPVLGSVDIIDAREK